MTLRALLFDIDGTFADTEEAHRQAFNGAFARHGYNWRWNAELYRDLLAIAGGRERIAHFIRSLGLDTPREIECLAEASDLHATKTALYGHAVRSGEVKLRPGIARLLGEAAAAGVALGIVTTTTAANVDALLKSTLDPPMAEFFAVTVTGEKVRAKKPSPEAYELALRELGLAPVECVAFEDSRNGLCSAHGAGIATVVTPCRWTRHEQFPEALLMLPHLGDPEHPLPPGIAARLTHPWLSLGDLDEALRHAA
jgi:HAD superfamily hydrolase (TIGR01509 family)